MLIGNAAGIVRDKPQIPKQIRARIVQIVLLQLLQLLTAILLPAMTVVMVATFSHGADERQTEKDVEFGKDFPILSLAHACFLHSYSQSRPAPLTLL